MGLADFRGQVVWGVLDYIRRQLPAVFILENVKHLLSKAHTEAWQAILKILRDIRMRGIGGEVAYSINFQVLNSKHYGVPQNRERVYIVGRRHDLIIGHEDNFNFGTVNSRPPPIREFLKIRGERAQFRDIRKSATNEVMKTNLKLAHTALMTNGINPCSVDVVVDVGSGQGLNMMHNMCPTITRSRGQNRSYYLTSVTRKLTTSELCRLQGLDPSPYDWEGIPQSAIGAMAGNAMSLPVLTHVIREALLTTGMAVPWAGLPIEFP
jgi:DNA (cytosine-5)-methyltransferase 1